MTPIELASKTDGVDAAGKVYSPPFESVSRRLVKGNKDIADRMSGSLAIDADDGHAEPDTWPWRCLRCGGTLYHDVELCRDCFALERYQHTMGGYGEAGLEPESPEGFFDWMRRQPASALSFKVSVIAGVELTLTTVWLQLLLGLGGLASLAPSLP